MIIPLHVIAGRIDVREAETSRRTDVVIAGVNAWAVSPDDCVSSAISNDVIHIITLALYSINLHGYCANISSTNIILR